MSKNFLITTLLVAGIFLTAGSTTTFAQNSSRTFPISSTKDKQEFRDQSAIVADVSRSGDVYFHASGFQTYELVTLSIEMAATRPQVPYPVAGWQTIADENGSFDAVWFSGTYNARLLVRASGQTSGRRSEAIFYIAPDIATVAAGDLNQCENGPIHSQIGCVAGTWVNSNLNGSHAHYLEGDSVPYRLALTGMTTGGFENTVTIEWDAVDAGHHGLDYLTTYDRTEAGLPCDGIATGCDPAVFDTADIPIDPMVTAGQDGDPLTLADNVDQIPGVFTMFGGHITAIGPADPLSPRYTYVTTSTKVLTSLTVRFTADVPNPVLLWGGHIATRLDWGVANSAIARSGAAFHLRILEINGGGGNQDRSLDAGAAIFPGKVTIIKSADWHSAYPFDFTATGSGVAGFTLYDYPGHTAAYPVSKTFSDLTAFAPNNTISITEAADPYNLFKLADIQCTVDPNGGAGAIGDVAVTTSTRNISIDLVEGESITCTYFNTYNGPTAANVSVGGRITNQNGYGVRNAILYMTPTDGSRQFAAISNPFGYYEFPEIPAGVSYVVSLSAKGYTFNPASMIVSPNDAITNLDFHATSNFFAPTQ